MSFFKNIELFRTQSKVLIPLMVAFLAMLIMVLLIWLVSFFYSQRVYEVLAHNSENSEKMLIITQLIETAHFRTRLTGQMLVTQDIFERDDIAQSLDVYASQFSQLRAKLLSLDLTDEEIKILDTQLDLIKVILPKQRLAAELAMSDSPSDIDKAKVLLYQEVIPGQATLINYFMKILNLTRDEVQSSSAKAINTHKNSANIKLVLIIVFSFFALLVASTTIRRILKIERNFNEANKELRRLNNVKTEFISLVSHELRTPLTSIKSFAEILMDDIEEMDVATQKRYLSIIDSEGDRLTRLVSNILDLQKIDANKMNWNDENLILNDLAKNSVDAFSGAYQAKNITLNFAKIDEELTVIADSDKLKQVMANLLSNALKFTDNGEVLVSVYQYKVKTTREKRVDMARVSVVDTGPGIPEDQVLKIFDSFHQVDNTATRKTGGSGLGLDICRKIVNHYEGNIWVESGPGKGSNFCFEIPLVKATHKKIGDTLIELGMITDDQLKIALQEQGNSK